MKNRIILVAVLAILSTAGIVLASSSSDKSCCADKGKCKTSQTETAMSSGSCENECDENSPCTCDDCGEECKAACEEAGHCVCN